MNAKTHNHHEHELGEVDLARKVAHMGHLIHRYAGAQARRQGALVDPLRGQGRVLALLKAKPETTQRELSYLLDMRQQSLSELLAKLEEKGFVTREKSAEDGRVTVVRLTDAGVGAAPSPNEMQGQADVLDCLSEEERTQLDALSTKVISSLEEKLGQMGIDSRRGPHHHGRHGHCHHHDGPHGHGGRCGHGRPCHDEPRDEGQGED